MQQDRHLLSVMQAATNTERLWTQYQPTVHRCACPRY